MTKLCLSIDLSSTRGSLALHAGVPGRGLSPNDRVAEIQFEAMRSSEQLLGRLDETLKSLGTNVQAIDRLMTGTGPGSFTGLRIAFATLKGLAMAAKIPLSTMSGAEARALAWLRDAGGESVTKVTVLTSIAAGSLAVSRFERASTGEAKFVSFSETVESKSEWREEPGPGHVILLDGNFGAEQGVVGPVVPLRARDFAEGIDFSITAETHRTLEEQIAVVPRYFGTARFTVSAATTKH